MDKDKTRLAYLEWAAARGLPSVTVYAGDLFARKFASEKYGLQVRTVPVADILGPAPAAEPDTEVTP